MSNLCGIWGKPYLDLSPFVNIEALPALAEEIPYALSQVEPAYTGGSLKWMGVTAPWVRDDPFLDYGHVIAGFSRGDFERFVSLAAEPRVFDLDRQKEYTFGDETDHPLTLAQMRWLEYRHGVYSPGRSVITWSKTTGGRAQKTRRGIGTSPDCRRRARWAPSASNTFSM